MRVAVYGGSFHPPHVGHAMVAAWVVWTDQADEVWLVPTYEHPFAKDLAPYRHRVRLCRALARTVGARVQVSTVEADLPVPSYTIDTMDTLARRHPDHRFRLVIGADVVADASKWKDWQRLAEGYEPIIVGRDGYPSPAGAVVFPDVSSTEVRRCLAERAAVDHLVPASVLQELDMNHYGGGPRPMSP